MNLGVNCLPIKSAKPNDSLLNTDKNVGEDCVPCLVCQSPRATKQVPGRGWCLIQAGMWHHWDIPFMLRASQGINSCRNAEHRGWKAVNVSSRDSSPPTVRVGHSSTRYGTSTWGMQGFSGPEELSQIVMADEEQREDVLYADHGGWKLRLNKAKTFVSSPVEKHLLADWEFIWVFLAM